MNVPDPRRDPRVVRAAQVAVVVLLAIVAYAVTQVVDDRDENKGQAAAVNAILAETCAEVPFRDLEAAGLVAECVAAQEGDLPEKVPEEVVSDPAEAESSPDVIPDDENATPADVDRGQQGDPGEDGADATNAQIDASVARYFAANPVPSTPGYQASIRRAVSRFITANPPPRGRPPTTSEIEAAARTVLLANPPADGEPGTPGRGVASAVLSGCDVVFTFSDGTTRSVGPLCGPPPTNAAITDAVVAFCNANGACRGPRGEPGESGVAQVADACTPVPGEFVTDASLAYEASTQTVTIVCTTAPLVGFGGDTPPGE